VATVSEVAARQAAEVASRWLEAHLAASPASADEAPVRAVHGRAAAALSALEGALAAADAADWSSFGHREAVQTITLMAGALAESGATAAAGGSLVPALVLAFEHCGAAGAASALLPLAAVAAEAFTAARLDARERQHQDALARSAPIVGLRDGVVLVAPCASPGRATASVIVERAVRRLLSLEVAAPVVILDLTHLAEPEPAALAELLSLVDEAEALGGECRVVGLTAVCAAALASRGLDPTALPAIGSVADGLADAAPRGLFGRVARRLSRPSGAARKERRRS
jgi:anti-anti-sigma regulatory factor